MAFSFSYSVCKAETVINQTPNAAAAGHSWLMTDLLPEVPGLEINGVIWRYTTVKDPEADLVVTIRNEYAEETGYIYEHSDDWSGYPGNTITGADFFAPSLGETWGQGEIVTTGEGDVVDATVRYNYKYDTCSNPLDDPSCAGFEQALLDYLTENGLLDAPDFNDPYYDEWVRLGGGLDDDTEVGDDDSFEEAEEEAEEEENLEQQLGAENSIAELQGNIKQSDVILQIGTVPEFEVYYQTQLVGGVYEDVLILEDSVLPDNRGAFRNLATDANHRSMVRSQYENN